MPRQKRDSAYENKNSSNRYNKDSLDHYNEDLSKRAVGSIFSNIERGGDEEVEEQKENIVVNTNFDVKDNKVRSQLVGQFFNDEDEAKDSKRRPKQARPQQGRDPKRPQSSGSANSALVRDDDTISTKYVTRGNHQPITTPAMAARRKNVTMMESQRMSAITDAEINEYKKQNAERNIAYVNGESKDTTPVDYDRFMSRNEVTSEQKEIIEYLKNEANHKEQHLEDTLFRLNEKNKHYQEIIDSTNKRLNKVPTEPSKQEEFYDSREFVANTSKNNFDNYVEEEYDDDFEEDFQEENILFGDALNEDAELNFTEEDLDKDFEETISSNAKSKPSKPFIPTKNLQETQSRMHTKSLIMSQDSADFYDLETDTYVTQKNKFATGDIKKPKDSVATEVTLDQLEELVFDNYDTADMEYLRKTIKEKTKAQKMQNLDSKIHEFEKNHRDFGGKPTPPARTTSRQRGSQPEHRGVQSEQRGVQSEQRGVQNEHRVAPTEQRGSQNENYSDSYEYRKSRQRSDSSSYDTANSKNAKYDTGSRRSANLDTLPDYDTDAHKRDYDSTAYKREYDTGSHNTGRVNSATGRIPTTRTSRIATVDLEQEGDDFQTKFNISLVINVIMVVAFSVVTVLMLMKNTSITSLAADLESTKAELLTQSNTITELQMDLDNYRTLYESTEEGKLSLQGETTGETTEGEESAETKPTGAESTYTVQSGDTLSSISQQFYGTSTKYQKIIDANSLTSDSLNLGQVLIIPE